MIDLKTEGQLAYIAGELEGVAHVMEQTDEYVKSVIIEVLRKDSQRLRELAGLEAHA